MYLLSVSGIYKFIQSCCHLHWQLMDSSKVELILGMLNCLMGYFVTLSIFVLVCVLSQIAKEEVC